MSSLKEFPMQKQQAAPVANSDTGMRTWEFGELKAKVHDAWQTCMAHPSSGVALASPVKETRDLMRQEILRLVGKSWQSIDTDANGSIWQIRLDNGSIIQVRQERV
jgi:hypothetical protein